MTQKVAIVTGASRGIGAVIAERLVADGFAVAVNYSSSAAEAETLVAKLQAQGGKAIAVKADVASTLDVAELFATTEKELGSVDVLVNNAGILKMVALAETSDELYERTFAINTRGTFNTMRAAAEHMNDGGRIVNFSSSTVGMNLPNYSVYIASKAAVESLTQVFAKELRGREITVNAVAPGPVATELFFNGKSDAQIETLAKMPPLERLGEPSDIAGVVAFLCGPDAGWINGQIIRANGGLV
jgi:3-oxoacyl-[acyl-carrier protein] reductase